MAPKRKLLWLEHEGRHYPFDLLDRKAQLLMSTGDWQRAEGMYREILSAVSGSEDGLKIATIKNQLGFVLLQKGENQEALKLLEEVYAYDRESGNDREVCKPVINIGNIYKNIGEYSKALEYYGRAIELGERCRDAQTVAMAWGNIGLVEWYQGNFDRAMESLERAMSMARQNGDQQQIGIAYSTMGNIQYSTGHYDQALECYRQQLTIARSTGDKYSLRVALNNMGAIHDIKGDFRQEIECFQRSLAIARELGNRAGERVVLSNLGGIHMTIGEFDAARSYFQQSLTIAERLGDRRGVGIILFNTGSLNRLEGRTEAALELYGRALSLLEELKVKDYWCECLLWQGELLFRSGQIGPAGRSAALARDLAQEIGQNGIDFSARILSVEVSVTDGTVTKEDAVNTLLGMLTETKDDALTADLCSALYRITGDNQHRARAVGLLQRLYRTIPKVEHQLKLSRLEQ